MCPFYPASDLFSAEIDRGARLRAGPEKTLKTQSAALHLRGSCFSSSHRSARNEMSDMNLIRKQVGVAILFIVAFLSGSLILTTETLAQLGLARVKVQALPVYNGISVTSGIVKILK
jgi:hypothetical protein